MSTLSVMASKAAQISKTTASAYRTPTISLPHDATILQGIHELRRRGITTGTRSYPDLRALPVQLKRKITCSARDQKLNMKNAERAIADEVVATVLAKIASLPPSRQPYLPEELGVDHIPGLIYATSTPDRRRELASAFKRALTTKKELDDFLNVSFMLQADAYSNADRDHPLCSMWNAGRMHAVMYMGAQYDDGPVGRWFGKVQARGGRGYSGYGRVRSTRRQQCIHRIRRGTRRRRTRDRTRH